MMFDDSDADVSREALVSWQQSQQFMAVGTVQCPVSGLTNIAVITSHS